MCNCEDCPAEPVLMGMNPSGSSRRKNDKGVQKISLRSGSEKRQENVDCIHVGRRMDFEADDTGVFFEWEHRPISEMLIQSDEDSGIGYGALKNLGIIGALLPNFGRPHDVITLAPKRLGYFDPKALV
jgi:hypothetical protein